MKQSRLNGALVATAVVVVAPLARAASTIPIQDLALVEETSTSGSADASASDRHGIHGPHGHHGHHGHHGYRGHRGVGADVSRAGLPAPVVSLTAGQR